MALPVGVLLAAAEAVRNPAVQDTAKAIFGWLRNRQGSGVTAATGTIDAAALLADVPTRAELALALSQIDVRIAVAERRCIRSMIGGLIASTTILATMIILL